MSGFTVFDIETGPLPDDEIRKIAPPFDPESVRTGNMGIEKIAEKIDGVRRNYFNGIKEKRRSMRSTAGFWQLVGKARETPLSR